MRSSPEMANGGSHPQIADDSHTQREPSTQSTKASGIVDTDGVTGYEPHATEGLNKRPSSKVSSSSRISGQPGRPFSMRSRDLPPTNLNYTTRKPAPTASPGASEESSTPRGLPPALYPTGAGAGAKNNDLPAMPSTGAPAVSTIPAPPSRSNTMRSSSAQQRDWASDRSPLQQLEVALNGISKEEKRAKVQEAERRLRERLARQKAEKEKTETAAHASPAEQRTHLEDQPALTSGQQKGAVPKGLGEGAKVPKSGQQPGTTMRHEKNMSINNPQYPTYRRPENVQYARAEDFIPSSAKLGNAPRRSTSLAGAGNAGNKSRPSSDIKHTRSVSQQGVSRPIQASPVRMATDAAIVSSDGVELPPAAKAAGESIGSYSKPKKQSVSFNVPPPTPPPVFEWRNAPIARLGITDFDFQHLDMDRSKAWWEGGGTSDRRKSRALPKNYQTPAQKLTGESGPGPLLPELEDNVMQELQSTKSLSLDFSSGVVPCFDILESGRPKPLGSMVQSTKRFGEAQL